MSDDDFLRDAADGRFIGERLMALDKDAKRDVKAVEDAYRRATLDLLRGGTAGPLTLRLVAGELEMLWWPKAYKKQRQRSRERAYEQHAASLIDFLAGAFAEPEEHRSDLIDFLKAQPGGLDKRKTRTLAKQAAAKILGVGVEGLRKRRRRYRQRSI
ncbi:MAG: hypothetical protein ACLPTZ_08825 [Beijerinckiaceae bacterium]|jgi:hypothetical protein